MQETQYIWQNGKMLPWAEAKVHVLTHTLHYGGGAFEGIRFYETDRGPAIFRLKEHIERLIYSARVVGMTLAFSADELFEAVKEVVKVNKINEGYIRPIVFYGYGKMGVNPTGAPTEVVIACWPWEKYLPHSCVAIKTSGYIRIHPRSTRVDAKLCGHYVNSILAALEVQGTRFQEAIFLDEAGYISEGVGENFFCVKDNIIYTPPLGSILPGITRDTVMKLAKSLNIKVEEKNISLSEAYLADEAFLSGTAVEITAVGSIDDNQIGTGETGPLTAKIQKAYYDTVHGKNAEHANFLTYV